MAPNTKRWINKKSATTFQVRYRSQQDPLIHDNDATDFVFTSVDAPNQKVKNASQLAAELGPESESIRANEGEAATYGIYYDDTAYDYMQHMRDIGDSVEGVFIEAPQEQSKQKGKGKGKQSLADALRDTPQAQEELIPKELLPSETRIRRSYQDQQDVPDVIAGFQPDMDPRLREVLEALEDEAYVDDDEDIFEKLAEGGEATEGEFEDAFFDEEDGWESDATEKPGSHQKSAVTLSADAVEGGVKVTAEGGDDWMNEFSKFKKAERRMKKPVDDSFSMADTMSFGGSSLGGTMSISSRTRRRHKKAGTESSGYSMSSSSLFRTEGLTTLDARFDRIEEEYADDNDEEDVPPLDGPVPEVRQDFNSIMDEFLDGYNVVGRSHRVRKGKTLTGLEQLDEIRRELGKARISDRTKGGGAKVRA